jgi:hypothetical protein
MQTITTNLKINASSQYTAHDYNSMCRFNGAILGAGAAGLFKVRTGDSDNAVKIDAYFIPVMSDLGSIEKKRPWYLYLGYECDGQMRVEITGDEEVVTHSYSVDATSSKGQHSKRIPLMKKYAWTYGKFKFSNVLGCDFSVDSIKIFAKTKKLGVK